MARRGRAALAASVMAAVIVAPGTTVVAARTVSDTVRAPAVVPPAGCAQAFPAYRPAAVATSETVLSDQAITMSDGVVLRADVTCPPASRARSRPPSPSPATASRRIAIVRHGAAAGSVQHGYATVTVDDRGTGTSGGSGTRGASGHSADYPEVLDWIVAQPWSDGRIGMTGASYMGITSLFAAATGHPAVKAVFATVPMGDALPRHRVCRRSAQRGVHPAVDGPGHRRSASHPTAPPDVLVDHLLGVTSSRCRRSPPPCSAATRPTTARSGGSARPSRSSISITVPTFIVGGLDDLFQRGEPMLYERARRPHRCSAAHRARGPTSPPARPAPRGRARRRRARSSSGSTQHVLGLDTDAECIPQVTQYVRGHERYESAPIVAGARPPRRALAPPRRRRPHRRASGAAEAGPLSTSSCRSPGSAPGAPPVADRLSSTRTPCATDNRLDEALSLTYTTDPFTKESVINGPIEADLWLASTPATDAATVRGGERRGSGRHVARPHERPAPRVPPSGRPGRARMLDGQSIQPWHPFTRAARADGPRRRADAAARSRCSRPPRSSRPAIACG